MCQRNFVHIVHLPTTKGLRQPTMLEQTRATFHAVIGIYPWVGSLSNILPLSALIDFLDVPQALHVYQLTGLTPWWCWTVTPSASRLLLSEAWSSDFCCLDNFGYTPSLLCLDGRYGDCYPMANPETVRMCLKGLQPVEISNMHSNMRRDDIRPHTLEVIHVQRSQASNPSKQPPTMYILSSALGWMVWAGLMIFTGLFRCFCALSFVALMPLTGIAVSFIYAPGPRRCKCVPTFCINFCSLQNEYKEE